jgi:A/G-specific adenine glycosylase
MLQQTRVAAVIPYFKRFLAAFPNYRTLAEASEEDVLRHWAGLGYYYRARNMQTAAALMRDMGGFPHDYEEILKLPGVGAYTAAAVASIAFDLPHAVLDGNVARVVSRLFASNASRKEFAKLADALLDEKQPGGFNQAMMELGATLCLPKNPQCLLCPVAKMCRSRELGLQHEFPAQKAKAKNAEIERDLFWIERNNQVLAWQRPLGARLMAGFWELPEKEQLPDAERLGELGHFRHGITVHNYRINVWRAAPPTEWGNCSWLDMGELVHLPLSTIFRKTLKIVESPSPPISAFRASVGN